MTIIYTMIGAVLWKSTSDGAVAKTSVTRLNMKVITQQQDANNPSTNVKTSGKNNDSQHKRLLDVPSCEPSSMQKVTVGVF